MKKSYFITVAAALLVLISFHSFSQGVNITLASQTNVLCNGSCTGGATVTLAGGITPYTYSWVPSGGTALSTSGLCAGTYTFSVTDHSGLNSTKVVTITQPAVLLPNASISNNMCFGASNGSLYGAASGGNGPYTWSWLPASGTTNYVSGLSAGTYTCHLSDVNGCSMTQLYTITQPTAITNTPTQTNITCNGAQNGTAKVIASGGSPGYSYSWSPSGGTAATASGLLPGTYTCTISDMSYCSVTAVYTLTQPAALALNGTQTNVTCRGSSTATATANVTGGTAPYNYTWTGGTITGGQGTTTATGLAVGTYTCTVTDVNGCNVAPKVYTITQPNSLLIATPAQSNVLCFGASTGTANITASGGNPAYSYVWTGGTIGGGQNTNSVTGLAAGNYTCTLTDFNGCVISQVYTITQTPAVVITPSQNNVSCNGLSDGVAIATVSGGTGSYTYAWSPVSGSAAALSGLSAGTFTVSITDLSCVTTQTYVITQPTALVVTPTQTNISCNGASTGKATVVATGGMPAYLYTWMPSGGNSATASNLPSGSYTCTLKDMNSCSNVSVFTLSQPSVLQDTVSVFNATCNGCDGKISASVSGATAPYTYSWTPANTSTSMISALCAGTYSLLITDANACQTNQVLTITQSLPPTITGKVTAPVSGPINSGMAYLVRYDSVLGHQQVIDSVAINAGRYTFNNSGSGKLLVYAIANKVMYPNTFKTYSLHATQWDSAQTTIISASCGGFDTSNINMYELNPMAGAGSLGGYIHQVLGYVPRMAPGNPIVLVPGDPIPGLDVNLEQHPGGIIAHSTTDGFGKYHFANVPAGIYQVLVDIPGLGMTAAYQRTILTNQMYTNLNYYVDSVHIYPDSVAAGINTMKKTMDGLAVSPNPFKNLLSLTYELGSESDVVLEIYNLLGESMGATLKSGQSAGSHSVIISAADYHLSPGIYFVKLAMEGNVISRKIVYAP
jgi:hypothetical protein